MKFAVIIKTQRESLGLTLKELASFVMVDAAILSKIENGGRTATRQQVERLIVALKLNEKEAITNWMADKILKAYEYEPYLFEALKVAEEQVEYTTKANKPTSLKVSKSIQALLEEADYLMGKWQSLKPLNKTQLVKMREHFSVCYTYDSNRIEGNTLTMQETHLVVNEGLTIGGKSMREHLEAVNHYEAIDFIEDLVAKKEPISERTVKEIHHLILKGIDRKNAGVYRSVPVMISGSSHIPPQPYLINKQMEEVFVYYRANFGKQHPILLAADMHEKVVTVHPFIDGNGRTSRLVMNMILLGNGYTVANIKGDQESRLNYYSALEKVQTKNNISDFYELIIKAEIESLKAHINLAV